MNYYDEFGVAKDAPIEEIRRAYRTLARLVHPDGQGDKSVKAAAERQMKRLNEIFAVLSDPAQRQAYDGGLIVRGASEVIRTSAPLHKRARWERERPPWMNVALKHWFWILMGATVLAAALWYVLASDSDAAVGNAPAVVKPAPAVEVIVKQTVDGSAAAAGPARAGRASAAPTPVGSAGTAGPARGGDGERTALRGYPPPEAAGRRDATPETPAALAGEQGRQSPAVIPTPRVPESAPATSPTAAAPRAGSKAPESPFAGTWLYSPQLKDRGGSDLYAPTYIEFLITEEDGEVVGDYRARYKTPEQAISPEVVFRASGQPQPGKPARLTWTSEDGAKGEVEMTLRSPGLMSVTWWTTVFGRRAALASGTAVLIREAR